MTEHMTAEQLRLALDEALDSIRSGARDARGMDLDLHHQGVAAIEELFGRISGMAAAPAICEQLGMAVVDHIASDGHRNAIGGIYATSVQDFALDIQTEFAQKNGLQIRGATPEPTND